MQARVVVAWMIAALGARAEAEPMKLEIHVKAKTFAIGDEIPVELELTNHGKTAFPYSRDQLNRLAGLELVVTDTSGVAAPAFPRRPFPMAWPSGKVLAVAPGQSLTTTEYLGYWVKLRAPGRVSVVAELKDQDGRVVRSAPITLALTPTSDQELEARIHALDASLATAKTYEQFAPILRKLTFIGRLGAAKSILEWMYAFHGEGMAIESFRFYIELPADFRSMFLGMVATRGLVPGMQYFLSELVPPATPDELFGIIQAALASGSDEGATWAVAYPDDRYIPKLVELASGSSGVRWAAIRALAYDRTDEGVACLRRVLAQSDDIAKLAVRDAVKNAYLDHGKKRGGHRLEAKDFPEIAESALAAAPIAVEARIDARMNGAMTIWDPHWKPQQFDGTHLVITSPPELKGKELIVIHDRTLTPSPASWLVNANVHFELSKYYFEHDLNPFEGAITGLRLIQRKP